MEPRKLTDLDVDQFAMGERVVYRGSVAAGVADMELIRTPTHLWLPWKITEQELMMLAGPKATIWFGVLGHMLPPSTAIVAKDPDA